MRLLQLVAHGEPSDVIQLATTPEQTLGQEDVLVSMEAAPLNPSDFLFVRGIYGIRPAFPSSLGETNGILEACDELGIGFVHYSPLGKGFLTWAMSKETRLPANDFRSNIPRFQPEAMDKNQAFVDLLKRVP